MGPVNENQSERFHQLSRWRSYFDGTQHDHKRVMWNNTAAPESGVDLYNVALSNIDVPDETKLDNKRPDAPENLGEIIVSTFTDLLFDEDSRPTLSTCEEDNGEKWNDWYRNFIEVTGFIDEFAECRNIAGSMSSALITLEFDNGIPYIKSYQSRYAIPKFLSAGKKFKDELEEVTIRYIYEVEEIRAVSQVGNIMTPNMIRPEHRIETVKRWFQRKITRTQDIVYSNPEYKENQAPKFEEVSIFEHNFGIVPALWIRNGSDNGIDSITDYDGALGLLDKVDMLSSMIARSSLYNGDPTVHVADDDTNQVVKTGSFATITTSSKGNAKFVEISGESIDAMIKACKFLRDGALRKCRCVIEVDTVSGRDRVTATEISSSMKRMFIKASKLRSRFGKYMERFLYLSAVCCSKLSKVGNDGKYEYGEFSVEDDFATPDDSPIRPRLKWGKFVSISASELKTICEAVSILKGSAVVDTMTLIELISKHVSDKSPEHIFSMVQEESNNEENEDDVTSDITNKKKEEDEEED